MVTNTGVMTLAQMRALAQQTSENMALHRQAVETLHRELTALRNAMDRDTAAGKPNTDADVVFNSNAMVVLSREHATHAREANDLHDRLLGLEAAIKRAEHEMVEV